MSFDIVEAFWCKTTPEYQDIYLQFKYTLKHRLFKTLAPVCQWSSSPIPWQGTTLCYGPKALSLKWKFTLHCSQLDSTGLTAEPNKPWASAHARLSWEQGRAFWSNTDCCHQPPVSSLNQGNITSLLLLMNIDAHWISYVSWA